MTEGGLAQPLPEVIIDPDLDASGLFSAKWQGHYLQIEFPAVLYNGLLYSVGDNVYLAPPNPSDKPYIAQIVSLYETNDRRKMMRVKWYYRPEDTRKNEFTKKALPKELYASEDCDDNPVGALQGICQVSKTSDVADLNAWVQQDHHYFYHYFYSIRSGNWTTLDLAPVAVEGTEKGEKTKKKKSENKSAASPQEKQPKKTNTKERSSAQDPSRPH